MDADLTNNNDLNTSHDSSLMVDQIDTNPLEDRRGQPMSLENPHFNNRWMPIGQKLPSADANANIYETY